MDTLARLIDRRAPIDPATACAEVRALFDVLAEAAAIAVVVDGKPVGLVYRDVFLGQMAVAPHLAARPVAEVMDVHPRTIDADMPAADFVEHIAHSATPIFRSAYVAVDKAGDYVGVGGLNSLLTSHRRRQREADEAMALVERMAHDIGHHLEGVLSFTERLEQSRLTPDASAYVRAIGDTSRDMNLVLGRAMDLRRAATGGLALSPAPALLRDLSDAVEARWAPRAAEGGSTLLFSYDGDPDAAALIDADRVMQVFDALIESALASGRGVIEASLKARSVEGGLKLDVRVRDNATGSAEVRLARVFDPLGAASMEDRNELALGVGMALAQGLTRAMGAPLRAEANLGAGLTLQFTLVAPEAILATETDDEPMMDARSAHILIVDDNATNRMVAEALCEMFDCTSEQVTDGVEAVEAARSGRFDLILMDIKMPRMDGVTATRAIRELPGRAGSAPIVALTANADPNDVATYIAAGMQDVVEKPIKPERLAIVLSALLGGDDEDEGAEAAA
ncbi:response regulator [Caulobacter sp. UNC279MFTsu5.1]|uniref:response regulator n=1 Tax=Caulobacter sp. UNC279MFTsu5.1 TaxID=1502775 RepID=UPI00035C1A0D|nr:response regulator [Caulobacter sp. UNC279MFTsu5.1]SFI92217.1 Histidine kinase-, DNA gyrase B-, and HSP90-like ATPase [Caulobacter sp. UNC279MFTsu5.1]